MVVFAYFALDSLERRYPATGVVDRHHGPIALDGFDDLVGVLQRSRDGLLTEHAPDPGVGGVADRVDMDVVGGRYADHVEIVRIFSKVGRILADDKIDLGGVLGEGPKDPATTMYPNQEQA